jgi:hypothetical protein
MMTGPLKISLGDQVRTVRPHPCGSDEWEIVRSGMDVRLKCLRCGRTVLMPRSQFEKRFKEFIKRTSILP